MLARGARTTARQCVVRCDSRAVPYPCASLATARSPYSPPSALAPARPRPRALLLKRSNNVGPGGAVALAKALERNATLTYLNLGCAPRFQLAAKRAGPRTGARKARGRGEQMACSRSAHAFWGMGAQYGAWGPSIDVGIFAGAVGRRNAPAARCPCCSRHPHERAQPACHERDETELCKRRATRRDSTPIKPPSPSPTPCASIQGEQSWRRRRECTGEGARAQPCAYDP